MNRTRTPRLRATHTRSQQVAREALAELHAAKHVPSVRPAATAWTITYIDPDNFAHGEILTATIKDAELTDFLAERLPLHFIINGRRFRNRARVLTITAA